MTQVPGWFPDPVASDQLRWWDGGWTSHVAVRQSNAMAYGAMTLGIVAFLLILFPIVSVFLSIGAIVIAIRAAGQNRDDPIAILVLSINVVVLSLAVYVFAWSVWLGLYGIVISPSPA